MQREKNKKTKKTGERYDKRYPADNRAGYSLMSYPGRKEKNRNEINIQNT